LLAIVAANVGIGFFQEFRAERTMESLRKLSSPTATVIRRRQGHSDFLSIPTSDIVIGDIVELRTGQVVPADLRLFHTSNLEIDESLLTGESLAVLKATDILTPADGDDAPLGDCFNLAYSGTVVVKGRAKGIVFATGMNSEIGKIARVLGGEPSSTTQKPSPRIKKPLSTRLAIATKKVLGLYNTSPLQTKLTKLAHFLFVTAVILVLVVFATARFNVSADVALYAISLALAIIPESLIAVVTITMAKGVTHMARRNAIVRRLDAIEALGGVTDICSDKTGTLTMGKMVVRKVWNGRGIWNCEGGDLSLAELVMSNVSEKKGDVNDLLRCAALCNGAVVIEKAEKWDATGEPTEVTLFFKQVIDIDRIANLCCKVRLLQVYCGRLVGRRRDV
jgi:P-type Na+/K+ transporter